ncbi:MAG: hypothetical protein ACLS3M_05180 [Collinsella sp.]
MSVIASVSKTTTGYISGEVKSTPVVSQQGDATYVYFTGNNKPGALYRYKVGDAAAEEIYTPLRPTGTMACARPRSVPTARSTT